VAETLLVALVVPFSAIDEVWFLVLLGYNLSIAVGVGLIAPLGVDAETGIVMLLYLDPSSERAGGGGGGGGRLRGLADLRQAVLEGAARRLRPKFMTVATTVLGLVPIPWATRTGSDVMERIAAPTVGGLHLVPTGAARLPRGVRALGVALRAEGELQEASPGHLATRPAGLA